MDISILTSATRRLEHPNIRAFLEMISASEGTLREPDPYRVTYGKKHTIADLSDHPAITGEWTGKRLPDRYCRNAGLTPPCRSTAAGAYQFIRPTWVNLKKIWRLPDFRPDSQDMAAFLELRGCGATQLILEGRIEQAIRKARRIWASLPGAGYGQPERSLETLLVVYRDAGGDLA